MHIRTWYTQNSWFRVFCLPACPLRILYRKSVRSFIFRRFLFDKKQLEAAAAADDPKWFSWNIVLIFAALSSGEFQISRTYYLCQRIKSEYFSPLQKLNWRKILKKNLWKKVFLNNGKKKERRDSRRLEASTYFYLTSFQDMCVQLVGGKHHFISWSNQNQQPTRQTRDVRT